MHHLSRSSFAAVAVASILVAGTARAQDYTCTGIDCLPVTTTTAATTATTAGVAYLIYTLATANNAPKAQIAAKAAEYYLRQNSLQLAQDLSFGKGAVLEEISSAVHVSKENEPAFLELMRKNRSELLALADPAKLNPDRAVLFVKRMKDLMDSHPGLSSDLRTWVAKVGAN